MDDPWLKRLPRNQVYVCEDCGARLDATDPAIDAFRAFDGVTEKTLCMPCQVKFGWAMHERRAGV